MRLNLSPVPTSSASTWRMLYAAVLMYCSATPVNALKSLDITDMWDWFPIVFFPLKIIVLGTGMFFAIKWHRDQEKKK